MKIILLEVGKYEKQNQIKFIFAVIAYKVGMAVEKFELEFYSFKNTGLGVIYPVTFLGLIFLTFKEKEKVK